MTYRPESRLTTRVQRKKTGSTAIEYFMIMDRKTKVNRIRNYGIFMMAINLRWWKMPHNTLSFNLDLFVNKEIILIMFKYG